MEKKRIDKTFGLIGKNLSHSFSPTYFNQKFARENIPNAEYLPFPLKDIQEFTALLELDIIGLNVTIPYKEQIIPYLDELDPIAKEIGAVNTIKFVSGKTIGYNSDVIGFEKSLVSFLGADTAQDALVLGSGGASKAIRFVLDKWNLPFVLISRQSGDMTYEDLSQETIENHPLIVNCTPLGMHPDINECPPIPYDFLTEKHYLFDLIYNPQKTLFLKKAEAKGARTVNGYDMLCYQAEESWNIWNKD